MFDSEIEPTKKMQRKTSLLLEILPRPLKTISIIEQHLPLGATLLKSPLQLTVFKKIL